MNKYNEIEIQTAKNLLKEGYKWLVRENYGKVYAYADKPRKNYDKNYSDDTWQCDGDYCLICTVNVSIFQGVTCDDAEPTSLERIVHPQILSDAEKQYLSAVIRPFRKNVAGIYKIRSCNSQGCRISISVSEHGCCDLPWFDDGTMYEGMREYRKYTIEELGL